jgi:hypothetical protein
MMTCPACGGFRLFRPLIDVPLCGPGLATCVLPRQGYALTSIDALRTEAARRLAQAINSTQPRAWWAAFAASYHELRASTQGRSRQQLADRSQPAEAAETD